MKRRGVFLVLMIFVLVNVACLLQTLHVPAVSPSPPPNNPSPEQSSTSTLSQPTTPTTKNQTITVFFTNQARFVDGILPFEVAVHRHLPVGVNPIRGVLDAFFAGPTPEESAQGLVLVSSGFVGVRDLVLNNGIAHIFLEGKCANNGAAYSVASVIARNLEQFPEIKTYKIYDEYGETLDPDSEFSSLPFCLEP